MKADDLGLEYLPDAAKSAIENGRPGQHFKSHDGSWDVWIREDGYSVRQTGSHTTTLVDWMEILVAMILPIGLALAGIILSLIALAS